MRSWTILAIVLVANLMTASPGVAAHVALGDTEAGFTWRLAFGGARPMQPGFALALGYRDRELDVAGQLLELQVDGQGTAARLAGLPLLAPKHRVAQDDSAAALDATEPKPWYTRQWVLWTAGGLAASLALTGGDGEVELCIDCNENGRVNDTDDINIASENPNGDVCGTRGIDGVPDTCVPVDGEGFMEDRDSLVLPLRPADTAWLDAGTGQMGDLVSR